MEQARKNSQASSVGMGANVRPSIAETPPLGRLLAPPGEAHCATVAAVVPDRVAACGAPRILCPACRGHNVPAPSPFRPNADVAQLVEQLIRNQQVSGSIPLVGSSFSTGWEKAPGPPPGWDQNRSPLPHLKKNLTSFSQRSANGVIVMPSAVLDTEVRRFQPG